MAAINDFVLNKNWNCIGKCGCVLDKWKYVNKEFSGFEIRIAVNGTGVFEIRHQDITKRSGTGLDQLTLRYKEIIG